MTDTRRGTTLIELVVVLLLLGLLMGLVVPALTTVRSGRTASTAVDSVRLTAVRRGVPVVGRANDSSAAFLALPDGRLLGVGSDSAR